MSSAFSQLFCVPWILGSSADPSLWQLSLEQFFGAKASIPVFKMSTETRMLVTTLVDQQTAEQPFRAAGLYTLRSKRTL